jgi:hypothetical protein
MGSARPPVPVLGGRRHQRDLQRPHRLEPVQATKMWRSYLATLAQSSSSSSHCAGQGFLEQVRRHGGTSCRVANQLHAMSIITSPVSVPRCVFVLGAAHAAWGTEVRVATYTCSPTIVRQE